MEHHLTVAQLRDVYSDSYIDADFPERSDGLSTVEARYAFFRWISDNRCHLSEVQT